MSSKVEIKTREEHGLWYDNNIDPYKGLAEIIAVTLKNSLISHKISFVDVPYRHKTKKSFLKKIEDKLTEKDYSPDFMTDLAGIRVITLIESGVQKVCDLIATMFNVHQADSINKSEKLGEEKVGYRSVHFVCDVGKIRGDLPEFSAYKGLCFEIQVRTALEHAWAEIEHDRGYKLGGKLPSHLNRRFKLLSGLLESADLEFNRLTVEIEEYAKELNKGIVEKNLDFEITNISLITLLQTKYSQNCNDTARSELTTPLEDLIDEINAYGIFNLNELDQLIQVTLTRFPILFVPSFNGFIRTIMMLDNLEKYFAVNFKDDNKPWGGINRLTQENLLLKYDNETINSILEEYKIQKL
ncbi:hypothetical protein KTH71_08060 [Acinetobacter sp. WU_MDCI_Axc73]|nr:hypothetical protein [Acinetobacter sp. WU_MDCI_Axc73]